MLDNTLLELNEVVDNEFLRASKDHGTTFASYHEGYAVLLEEFEEAQAELCELERAVRRLWSAIKNDDMLPLYPYEVKRHAVKRHAVLAAAELVQVAAMAEKLRYTNQLFNEAELMGGGKK